MMDDRNPFGTLKTLEHQHSGPETAFRQESLSEYLLS
jgi:hypothetical protein